MIPAGTIIYCSHACADAVEEAKDHAKRHGLTPEDAQLIRRDDMIKLVLRKPWQTQKPAS